MTPEKQEDKKKVESICCGQVYFTDGTQTPYAVWIEQKFYGGER